MVCPHCGSEFEPEGRRSGRSNRYLWAVVYTRIAAELGYTAEQVHLALKDKFLGRDDPSTGLRIVPTSTTLDPVRFGEYIEQIRDWSRCFLNLYIPEPGEGTQWVKPDLTRDSG